MNTTPLPFTADVYPLPPFTLRSLQPSEAAPTGLRLAAMDPWKRLGYSAAAIGRFLTNPDPALKRFTVQDAKETIGVVCIRFPWLRGPYLELLAIFPEDQGRGTGQAILAWIEEQARLTSNNIWALTSEFNLKARAFYQAAGFVEIAPIPGLVASGFSEILLRKTLDAG
jgi:diamine N-acetyltransferase